MFKNKILSTLLLSAVLLTSFSYSAKAAPSNSARTTSSTTVETELQQIINSNKKNNFKFADGVLLGLKEKMNVSTYKNIKIYNTKIVELSKGVLIPKKEGTTYITYTNGGYSYIKEIGVINEKSISTATNTPLQTNTPISSGFTVCIDPGHGGSDPGASANGLIEKALTLETSLKVEELLEAQGVTVYLTRKTDTFVSLTDRAKFMSSKYPNASISIHYNAATSPTANGIETYYYNAKTLSYELATELQNSLIFCTDATNRGIKQASFTVISKTRGYSALVEGGFISNEKEAGDINNPIYKQKIAQGIADGIMNFLK